LDTRTTRTAQSCSGVMLIREVRCPSGAQIGRCLANDVQVEQMQHAFSPHIWF
jgi:hypothetical protein